MFCETVSRIVRATGQARLFAHWYSGRVGVEDVGTAARLTIPLEEFMHQGGTFDMDTVVELVREAG